MNNTIKNLFENINDITNYLLSHPDYQLVLFVDENNNLQYEINNA